MRDPILYSFRRCPYAMRARLALYVRRRSVELREVVLRDKPEDMRAVSPKATVPVLVLETGEVIDESLDVMTWAWPDGLDAMAAAIIAQFDGPFKHHLDRYKYASRFDADPSFHRDQAVEILDSLVLRQNWLSGPDPGFVDYAILPFIRQFRIADPVWFDETMPRGDLRDWLFRFLDLPAFEACMKKYPAWQQGQPGICFP